MLYGGILGLLLLAAGVLTAADARQTARMPYQQRLLLRPPQLSTIALGVYDETSYRARELRWRAWGTSHATGRGSITHCVAEYVPCETHIGTVELQGLATRRCGEPPVPTKVYKRIRFRVRRSDRVAKTPYIPLLPDQLRRC